MVHRVELVDYAAAIVGDRARGEDIVQEAFFRWSSAIANRPLDEPVGYLRKIVRNLALDWTRRAVFERRVFDTSGTVETIAADSPSPEEALLYRDDLRAVMRALAELPDRTRIAIEMHRFEGKKLREIAEHLGISVALAHALVVQGLEHCRKRIAVQK